MKWFDRKFNFSELHGTMGGIIERLEGTPMRLKARINSISSSQWVTKEGDKWSIQEQAGHLLDLEPLWFGRVEDMLERKEILREADLSNTLTHQADHNSSKMEDLLNKFHSHRNQLIRSLRSIEAEAENLSALHPRLRTPMRLIDLAFFVAEHDDHHLAEIYKLGKDYQTNE